MRFRPCIDIHNGKVKQIVGGSLTDQGDQAVENFAASQNAGYFANMYKKDGLKGGHVILLNPATSPYYKETLGQAKLALETYPGGLQIGGGINPDNAKDFLTMGASHVIVTSYVFKDGEVKWDRLLKLKGAVGKDHLVIDLSCRKKEGAYYIVTDRWQKFTKLELTPKVLDEIASYCDEFLVHGVDVEGKSSGVEEDLVKLLKDKCSIPVTYAGGIGSLGDLEKFRNLSEEKLDFTIGSALDIFGGSIPYAGLVSV